jgi:uncharacterized protein YdhG (YjbR/CyaY superfamily)
VGTVDDYLSGLEPGDRAIVARVYQVARSVVAETEQGTSYGMPALLYRGAALLSVMRAKKHSGVYPFSGRVPELVAAQLEGFDHDKGTIRFQPEHPLPDDAIRAVVSARVAEIEGRAPRAKTG